MATSSITKDIVIEDVDRFLNAIEESARKQGVDLDAEPEAYGDDLADIFPWLPRGEYKRVKE